MSYTISKDWEWFLAEVVWNDSLFAFWSTEEEALRELWNVVEMTMDYHLELIEQERNLKNLIFSKFSTNTTCAV